jgi:hypothetical protein
VGEYAIKLEEAQRRLPLKRLMEQRGRAPANGNWKTFPHCPYCQHKDSAGVKMGDRGLEFFKCFNTSCPTGTHADKSAWDAVAFLQYELKLHDRKEAAIAYMKEAGVWTEREARASTLRPGAPARRHPLPEGGNEIEPLMREALDWLKQQPPGTLSMTSLMKELGLGYGRVCSVIEELKKRGLVAEDKAADKRFRFKILPVAREGAPVLTAPSIPTAGPAPAVTLAVEVGGGVGEETPVITPPAGTTAAPIAGGGSIPGAAEDAPTSPAVLALRWFYERLTLSAADRKALWEIRALLDATIDLAGFRSNPQSNKELLLEMKEAFSTAVLLDCGLWKTDDKNPSAPPKPNPQFYGMSIREKRDSKGKKVRDEDGEAIKECVWDNPILIPYFDAAGELVHLRPHKGMLAGRTPQFYVCRGKGTTPHPGPLPAGRGEGESAAPERRDGGRGAWKPQYVLISEGEFKSWAQWQVLGDVAACGALPGITMAKPLFGDIEEWLEESGVRQVIVGYDREEKGDEALPGYQEDSWRRFDAQIWARYLARQLSKQGYDGKVCVLPKEWQNKEGKADWDGRLADLCKEGKGHLTPALSPKGGEGEEKAVWERVKGRARAEFLKVIHAARPVMELWQAGFFDSEEERIIKNGLERISYEPRLPIGGDDEQVMCRRLHRLAMQLKTSEWFPVKLVGFLHFVAQAYQSTAGRYYILKPLSDKLKEDWKKQLEIARTRNDDRAKRACEIILRGKKSLGHDGHIPEPVSDFHMKAHYVLHRVNGTRTRMVTLHNVHGVNTGLTAMPSEAFGSPVKLRDWLLNNITGAAWNGGQNELSGLHEDMGHEVAFKDVLEVPLRGYHEKSRMWFFEDIAFSEDGEFKPDPKTGIFWVRRDKITQGYSFARDASGRPRDREDEVFRQGVPLMHPEKASTDSDDRDFFKEAVQKLQDTLRDQDACMALGMVLGCAAGPEIYKEFSACMGLWVHGAQGEGKSSLVRWLLRIWGFNKEKGLPLPADERGTLTPAALAGALGQYGELLLWLDEYQPTAPGWIRAILKNCYDRMEGGKKDFGASPREFLASVIVSGIATSSETQTKGRFAHIQVSAKNRRANHYQWFQTHSHEFYRIGRFLMRHRKAYAASAVAALHQWIQSPKMTDVDDRTRMVHGMAYAGFHAACEGFNIEMDMKGYWNWLVEHCRASAQEVQEGVSVDLFWREVLNGLASNAFGETPADRRRIFKVVEDETVPSPVSEHQTKHGAEHGYTAWKSHLLYFQPGPVIEMLKIFKRKSGGNFPCSQSDLLHQMQVRECWMSSKSPYGHRQKFDGVNRSCWCNAVDRHELGLIQVPDQVFDESLMSDAKQGTFFAREDWTDPRKGDLFALIESLQSKKEDHDDASADR